MNKIRLLNGVLNAVSKDFEFLKKDIDALKMKERLTEVEIVDTVDMRNRERLI